MVDREYHRNWYRNKRATDPDYAAKRKAYRLANYERLRAQEIASRQRNIDKHRASSRERMKQMRAERPEHVAKLRKRADLKRKYGLTPEQKAEMLATQGGCGICKTDTPGSSDWHVDHCHTTGHVRGVLCSKCNLMLGHARDNTTTLSRAVDYLQRNLTQRGKPMSDAPAPIGHNNPPPEFDIEKRISQYVALRDKIKAIKDKHKAELEPFNEALELLGAALLNHLNTTKQDSANARSAGTAYRTTQKSASIVDADAFRRHVIGTQAYELLDWKANATAIEAFLTEHETLPPGIKYTTRDVIGVRRA